MGNPQRIKNKLTQSEPLSITLVRMQGNFVSAARAVMAVLKCPETDYNLGPL